MGQRQYLYIGYYTIEKLKKKIKEISIHTIRLDINCQLDGLTYTGLVDI